MIRLYRVWKSYGRTVALADLSFEVGERELVLVTGPSGAGKSTLLRLLHGAERAERGQVLVTGQDLSQVKRSALPYLRRHIGVAFQDFKLLRERTAFQNVAVALDILGIPHREQQERIDAALTDVGLQGFANVRVDKLSGGEQQRIAVARAIVGDPNILLADEPTANLDPHTGMAMLNLLERVRQRGTTVLVATHDPEAIKFGATQGWRRVRLHRGRVVEASTPEAIAEDAPSGPVTPITAGTRRP